MARMARKMSQTVSQMASRRFSRRESGSTMGSARGTQLPSNRRKPFRVNWSFDDLRDGKPGSVKHHWPTGTRKRSVANATGPA